ncbi:MAG TPA: LamG-like jellyroll fold domain-containing protein [Bacteroidota bacterium]|nr:LamG-like jellyroll fold domain-containing protein [Bacteroidota bacterium]
MKRGQYFILAAVILGLQFGQLSELRAGTPARLAASTLPTANLLAYWPLNAGANDTSGNGYNGTPGGGATWNLDRFGVSSGALSLNGTDSYIDFGNVHPTINDFSVSLWFVPATLTTIGTPTIISDAGGYRGFRVYQVMDSIYFETQSTNISTLDVAWGLAAGDVGRWIHLVGTSSNGELRLYIDSVLVRSIIGSPGVQGVVNLNVGRDGNVDRFYWAGSVDDVRLYDQVLSAADVRALYSERGFSSLNYGLLAFYPFSGNANDASGNGNNGIAHAVTLCADRFGNPNDAFQFNGTGSYVDIGKAGSLGAINDVTFAAWAKFGPGSTQGTLIGTYGTNNAVFLLAYNDQSYPSGKISFLVSTTTEHSLWGYGDCPDLSTGWHHIVFTRTNGNLGMYVDGSPVNIIVTNERGDQNGPIATGLNLFVGAVSGELGASSFFSGTLDDIRIYNRVLTVAEVNSLYQENDWSRRPAWTLQLTATAGAVLDNQNYLGVSINATDGFDPSYDTPKPPVPSGNYVQLYFPHPEYNQATGPNFAQDIRTQHSLADTVTRWAFEVVANFDTTVSLSFISDGDIPSKYGMVLKDLTSSVRKNLVTGGMSYAYRSGPGGSTRDFEILIGDSTAPVASILKPNGGEIVRSGKSYPISLSDVDKMGIDSLQLFYSLDAGSTYNKITTLSGSASSYSWSVPPVYLNTQASVKLIATDTMGNTATDASNYVFTISGDSLATSFTSGWNLIGTPEKPKDSTVSGIFGDDISQSYYLWDYSQSAGYTTPSFLAQGRGYWLGLLNNATVDAVGAPVTDSSTVSLSLGFNMVSDPLVVAIPRDSLKFRKGGVTSLYATANASGWIASGVQGYNKSTNNYQSTDTLQIWNGYWLAALQSGVDLVVTPPLNATVPAQVASPKENTATPKDWQLRIIAASGVAKDETMMLGVKPDAADGFDVRYDQPKAPTPPGGKYVEAYFSHPSWAPVLGSRFNTDLHKYSSTLSWTFAVSGSDSTPVTLSWTTGGVVPDSIALGLQDLSNGTKVNMRTQSVYTFTPRGVLQFAVNGTVTNIASEEAIPTSFALLQNYPNPFNPSTTISFALPEGSMVKLVVYDLVGREVAILANERLGQGYYSRTFDGSRLSSGVYFYRISAQGQNGTGQSFSQVKKLILLK